MEWVDFALIGTEQELSKSLDSLDDAQCANLKAQLCTLLSVNDKDLERKTLRLLLERARPMALPASLWQRAITDSSDIRAMAAQHLQRLGIEASEARTRSAQELYARFSVETRQTPRITTTDLEAQSFRCAHCGLAFCDEELAPGGLQSPFGFRGRVKPDLLKPHWNKDEYRVPTVDHDWPISLYGSNDRRNLRILCKACNIGKANFLSVAQTRPFIGLPYRKQLAGSLPLHHELFFAQIWYAPRCVKSGASAKEIELTVERRDPQSPFVLDNLLTVESPGV